MEFVSLRFVGVVVSSDRTVVERGSVAGIGGDRAVVERVPPPGSIRVVVVGSLDHQPDERPVGILLPESEPIQLVVREAHPRLLVREPSQ